MVLRTLLLLRSYTVSFRQSPLASIILFNGNGRMASPARAAVIIALISPRPAGFLSMSAAPAAIRPRLPWARSWKAAERLCASGSPPSGYFHGLRKELMPFACAPSYRLHIRPPGQCFIRYGRQSAKPMPRSGFPAKFRALSSSMAGPIVHLSNSIPGNAL